jgi:PAS domain S-box-containing protein
MTPRQPKARNRLCGANKKPRRQRSRKIRASARPRPREFIGSAMKRTKTITTTGKRVFTNGASATNNSTAAKSLPTPTFRHPKTQLEQAIRRYIDLFDFAPIGYVTFNRAGRIEEINFTAVRLLGRSRKQLIGSTFGVCVAKEDVQTFMHHLLECRSSDGPVVTELHLQRPDGEKFPVQLSSTATLTLMKDGARLYQTAIVDLTERKRAENAVHESDERIRSIVEQANAGIARYNANGDIEFANEKFCKMLGYQQSELIGKNIREFTHSDDVEKTMGAFERVLKKGKLTEIEKRYIRRDGSVVWANVSDAPERDELGRPRSVAAVTVDITARKKAEAMLQKSKELLENLVQQRTKALRVANAELKNEIERRKGLEGEILEISDREQQRLGQELHDGLCQHLTAVAFMARSVALRLKNHRVIDVKDIEKIAQLVNDAATDTRNLSRALHRIDIDAAGLVDALEDLVDREIWRTPCRLEVKPSFHIEDDVAAAQLYRIAREAVINANKHGQAREIVVALGSWRTGIVLSVTDDGVGFQSEPTSARGLGLPIMNYRARSIGGRLEIESPKKGGTQVACYLPTAHSNHTRKEMPGEGDSLRKSPKQ